MSVKIGPYTLPSNVLLAPMAGVTDRPFRMLCRRFGAGLAASEMLSADVRLWDTPKSRRRMDHSGEPSPRVVQIAGFDPYMMAEAARRNIDAGAEIIDINMGCPAKKVCNVAAGSALLQNEPLVQRIVEAVVGAVGVGPDAVPVTLKIRTGWNPDNRNGVRIARIAQDSGIASLAVHGRTRADLYNGHAEYDTIAAIKQAIGIPVLANGDIDSPHKARQVLEYTKCDGVMIGRAAQGRPWIMREIAHYLATGQLAAAPSPAEVRDILCGHLEHLYEFYGETQGVRIARKHLGWYAKDKTADPRPAAAGSDQAAFRAIVNRAESAVEQLRMTRDYFSAFETGMALAA
jgi:tRNA-dihydrouridine synthase B